MRLKRVQELPLSPAAAGDRVAEAAGKLGWEVRDRSAEGLSLSMAGKLSQLQLGITVTANLDLIEPGRTRITMTTSVWNWRRLRRQIAESRLSALAASVEQRGASEDDVPSQVERWLIRLVIGALAVVSLTFALAIDIPREATVVAAQANVREADASAHKAPSSTLSSDSGSEEDTLPAIALDQPVIYRSEICLGVFYLGLLILVPLYYGVVRGRFPTEISARGARFAADEISGSLDVAEKKIEQLDQRLVVAEGLIALTRSEVKGGQSQ